MYNFSLKYCIFQKPSKISVCYFQTELITSKGYPCDDYTVETEDGFLLSVQRIRHGRDSKYNSRGPVFLQHGLLCSSTNWVTNLANESLGKITYYHLRSAAYSVFYFNARLITKLWRYLIWWFLAVQLTHNVVDSKVKLVPPNFLLYSRFCAHKSY